MITKRQRANADDIVLLAQTFGHLAFNEHGQTPNSNLNLSIPCAHLVVAGVVTGVEDSYNAVNDQAVEDVREYCKKAVEYTTSLHGEGWWTKKAADLL